jgi:hypothetical protein
MVSSATEAMIRALSRRDVVGNSNSTRRDWLRDRFCLATALCRRVSSVGNASTQPAATARIHLMKEPKRHHLRNHRSRLR